MKRFLIITVVIGLFGGCVSVSTFIQNNRMNLAKLSYGMPKEQVNEIMGQETVHSANNPYRTAMFMSSEGVQIEVFYYWTDVGRYGVGPLGVPHVSGIVTDDELTPVVFNNGKVVGWGREFWNDYSKKFELTVKQR